MRTYLQLTEGQRYQIVALLKAGHTNKKMAELVGTSEASMCRELRRNRGQRGYPPKPAQNWELV